MAEKKRIIKAAIGLAIAVGLGAVIWQVASRTKPLSVTVATVQKGHVEQTVTAISAGTVKPRIDSQIAAETIGTVVTLNCKEGDRVQPGTALIELNHAELDAQVALAEANLKMGQSKLEQAKIAATINEEVAATKVAQAKAQMDQARSDYARLKALKEKNAVSQSELDKVALVLRVAEETSAAAIASQHENDLRREEVRSAEYLTKLFDERIAPTLVLWVLLGEWVHQVPPEIAPKQFCDKARVFPYCLATFLCQIHRLLLFHVLGRLHGFLLGFGWASQLPQA